MLTSRKTIQQSRITLSLDTHWLSPLCPGLIGMAGQHWWCSVCLPPHWTCCCLHLLTVGVCLLAVLGLFSSILLIWSFALTAVRLWLGSSHSALCPSLRSTTCPCRGGWQIHAAWHRSWHTLLWQNCVSLQPGLPYCDIKAQVPTFLCIQFQSRCEPRWCLSVKVTKKWSTVI